MGFPHIDLKPDRKVFATPVFAAVGCIAVDGQFRKKIFVNSARRNFGMLEKVGREGIICLGQCRFRDRMAIGRVGGRT